MAYGTPASPADVEAYYTHIRRGRPPTPEQLTDLQRRYDAIGGVSPLRQRTEAQAACVARELGGEWRVELGYKHTAPFIEEAAASLATEIDDAVVGVVLAPHYSRGSIGEYAERLGHPTIESWHDLPEWLDFQANAVRAGLERLPSDSTVVFTAHSLPERVLDGDPYPEQLAESAAEIATRAGVRDWSLGWQSAGRTPEPWRGPDILEVIASTSHAGMLVCAQGFTSDHLEVLYDLDVAARDQADAHDVAFTRTAMVNDDHTVLTALAARVRSFTPS